MRAPIAHSRRLARPGHVLAGEAAEILGVSKNTIHNWMNKGELRFTESVLGYRHIPTAEIQRKAKELAKRRKQ